MKTKVSSRGLVIPREMLADVEEVEILKENNRIVISPVTKVDPILGLGKNPVCWGVSDASERHDRDLYRSGS